MAKRRKPKRDYSAALKNTPLSVFSIFLAVFAATIVIYLIERCMFGLSFSDLIKSFDGALVNNGKHLSQTDRMALDRLILQGSVIPSDVLMSSMVSFYNTIITWFAALVTIAGFVVFLYIKGMSVKHAEDMIEDRTAVYFENLKNSKKFFDDISKELSESDAISAFLDDIRNLDPRSEIESLKNEMSAISKKIAKMDKDEETTTVGSVGSILKQANDANASKANGKGNK